MSKAKLSNLALDGKQLASTSPKKNVFSYRTRSSHSNVDETLFGTPTRFLQQVETKRQSHDADWDPPWFTGPNRNGRPLLWTPFSSINKEAETKPTKSIKQRPRSASSSRIRKIKQTSSNFKDLNSSKVCIDGSFEIGKRPYKKTSQTNVSDVDSTSHDRKIVQVPVIKHRSGSNLTTSQQHISTTYDASNINNDTISKALQLASQSKQAHEHMIASRSVKSCTPTTTPRTPRNPRASNSRASSPRNFRIARMSDFTLPLDKDNVTNLSATGSSLALSTRETPRYRPNSARSGKYTNRSTSSSFKPSWKP